MPTISVSNMLQDAAQLFLEIDIPQMFTMYICLKHLKTEELGIC